ncbi:hypothetical protein Hanom_Chr16g01430011 [Helianthus anomalus]
MYACNRCIVFLAPFSLCTNPEHLQNVDAHRKIFFSLFYKHVRSLYQLHRCHLIHQLLDSGRPLHQSDQHEQLDSRLILCKKTSYQKKTQL